METLGEIKCKEEMEVNIVEYRNNDNSFKSFAKDDPDATEYSSSFADSSSDVDRCSGLSEGEVEMQMFNENGYASPFNAFSSALRLRKPQGNFLTRQYSRKKKLTNHWRSFIRPLMWRCKWTELRIKEIESQATIYSKYLETYKKRELSGVDQKILDEYGSKSLPSSTTRFCRRKQVMKRRKRKKNEEKTDVISYMTQHNLFSYLESKRSDLDSISVADDFAAAEKNVDDDENFGNFNESTLEFRDGDHSLEQILSKIEGVHSRLHKLKNQMDIVMSRHAAKFSSSENLSFLDTALSPALLAGDGEAMSAGAVDNPAKDCSDYEAGEVVVPESAISSYDGVVLVLDVIESPVGLSAAAEVDFPQSQIGDSGECIMEGVLMDQRAEGAEEDDHNLNSKAMASDDQSSLKSCLASNVNFPSKRKRGERKAGSGSWKKTQSSEPESQ